MLVPWLWSPQFVVFKTGTDSSLMYQCLRDSWACWPSSGYLGNHVDLKFGVVNHSLCFSSFMVIKIKSYFSITWTTLIFKREKDWYCSCSQEVLWSPSTWSFGATETEAYHIHVCPECEALVESRIIPCGYVILSASTMTPLNQEKNIKK